MLDIKSSLKVVIALLMGFFFFFVLFIGTSIVIYNTTTVIGEQAEELGVGEDVTPFMTQFAEGFQTYFAAGMMICAGGALLVLIYGAKEQRPPSGGLDRLGDLRGFSRV